jgi:DNA-binding transcriptional MerR regulator
MNSDSASSSLPDFSSDPEALLPIDTAAQLARMPRHFVLICCQHGLVAPHHDPAEGGYYFNRHAVRALQRIEYLRSVCGVNLTGIELIMKLMADVEELRALARR